jgi:esterase/lipase
MFEITAAKLMLLAVLLISCLQGVSSDSQTLQRAVAVSGSTATVPHTKGSGLKVNCKQWSKSSLQRTAAFSGEGQVLTAFSSTVCYHCLK